MKKYLAAVLALALALSAPLALAEGTEFSGALQFDKTVTVCAPYAGRVQDFSLRAGDRVQAGDTLFTLDTLKIFAPCDGTVEGLFVKAGDNADAALSRYGALCSVMPTEKLVVSGRTQDAYSYAQRDLTLGQTLYLKNSSSASREGAAIVTAVSDGAFSAEVTAGTLRASDLCTVYAEPAMRDASRVGSGTVSKRAPIALQGTGTVLNVYVKNGSAVRAGDLLLETVDGVFGAGSSPSSLVAAPASGVVVSVSAQAGAAVQKDQPLALIAPEGSLIAAVTITEDDLPLIKPGDAFTMTLDLDQDAYQYIAVVRSIGAVNVSATHAPAYTAYLTFSNDDFVREGMRVTIRK